MSDRSSLHHDRVRAGSFGSDAEQYDRARPSYPAALIDLLVSDHPTTVLDAGCGTGIATRLLAERGCEVLGVEPDARMAEVARRGGLEVEVGSFEEWEPNGRTFDLVTFAQAWHWVEPVAGTAKLATLIEEGGKVGLFWNVGRPSADERATFDACYRRHAPGLEQYAVLLGHGVGDRFADAVTALRADGHFVEIDVAHIDHLVRYTTSEWLEQLMTHSDHKALDPDVRRALFADIGASIDSWGGAIDFTYEVICVTARRVRDPAG